MTFLLYRRPTKRKKGRRNMNTRINRSFHSSVRAALWMMFVSHNHRFLRAVVAIVAGGWFASAAGAATNIYGGPTYDATTKTGYLYYPTFPVAPGGTAGDGVAVGHIYKDVSGINRGNRAVRWDASGTPAIELGNLGTDNGNGYTNSYAYAVNTAGTAVGYATKYVSGIDKGNRAVRWDASGTATELGNLGIRSDGVTSSQAYAINTAGTAVGYSPHVRV